MQHAVVSYTMHVAGNKAEHWERHLLKATTAPSCSNFFLHLLSLFKIDLALVFWTKSGNFSAQIIIIQPACFGAGCYIEMATSYHYPHEHELVGGWRSDAPAEPGAPRPPFSNMIVGFHQRKRHSGPFRGPTGRNAFRETAKNGRRPLDKSP